MNLASAFEWTHTKRRNAGRALAPRTNRLSFDFLEQRQMLSVTRLVDAAFTAGELNSTHFNTIQSAVNASNAGDSIRVTAGVYNESVVVSKTLKIVGAQPFNAAHRVRDAAHESIVDPAGVSGATVFAGFNLQADNITIEGFTIADNFHGVPGLGNNDGIITSRQFSGYRITDNYIEENTLGIYLNSNGVNRTVVEDNVFRANNENLNVVNPTAPVAFAAGNAIYSDQGLFNATIDDNSFTGQSNASIILIGGGTAVGGANSFQANVTITDNDLLNDAAIILANTTSSKIDGNSIHGSTGSAIFLAGGVNRVDITNNDIRDTAFTGINVRFLPGGATAGGYNVAIPDFLNFISGNFIKNSGDAGIRLRDMANGNTVASNTVVNTRATTDPTGSPPTAGFGDGITIEGSAYNTVRDNIVRASGGYGIALLLNPGTNAFNPFGTVSFSNTVSGNTVANNALAGVIVIGDGLFNAGVTNRVQSNTATQNVDGFVLLSASGVTLRSNTINQSSEDGVRLSNSKNNSLSQNGSFNNGRDGFRVQTTSSGNSLTSNSAFGNDDFDFFDNTVGAGSGGTANTYSSNHGDRANVSGLVH